MALKKYLLQYWIYTQSGGSLVSIILQQLLLMSPGAKLKQGLARQGFGLFTNRKNEEDEAVWTVHSGFPLVKLADEMSYDWYAAVVVSVTPWPLWIPEAKLAPHLLWTLQFLDLPLSSYRGTLVHCNYTMYDLCLYHESHLVISCPKTFLKMGFFHTYKWRQWFKNKDINAKKFVILITMSIMYNIFNMPNLFYFIFVTWTLLL